MTYTTDKYNYDTLRVPTKPIHQRLQDARREIAGATHLDAIEKIIEDGNTSITFWRRPDGDTGVFIKFFDGLSPDWVMD